MRVYFSVITIIFAFFVSPVSAQQHVLSQARDAYMADLVSKIKASTVSVGTYSFKDIPMIQFRGTGFAIGDGSRIVTNHHVVQGIKEKKRMFHLRIFHKNLPGKGVKAVLVAEDPFHDLAILEMAGKLAPLPMAAEGTLKEGHQVAFTGFPIGFVLGLNATTHTGIVSAIAPVMLPSPHGSLIKGEMIKYLEHPWDIIQLDAVAFPGNSGSPVYRISTGQVVGVINKVFVKGKKEYVLKEPTGITYAVPVSFVRKLNRSIIPAEK
ncbi:serine protease [Desulfobacter hydrogenophilus]|uniref:Serine protease n=2 Tax=Desulfobacter hydrogenophilus TaxID=2291 RepID=A0A328FEZ1_9BACT|nr:trypsin-like peptidase domain-containing protein [Desulfobacter hydrogenophilus]QBH11686.1 serine protease [Desulfobacter hydrogenophilus]RAM02899.1 serine protease [Desulfobacter hydrogenophilus]